MKPDQTALPADVPAMSADRPERPILRACLHGLDRVETVLTGVAASMMALIMVIITLDVVLRYVFNSPLSWVADVTSFYLMVGLFFLALPGTYAVHGHITVDILSARFPVHVRRMVEAGLALVAAVVFACIAYACFDKALVAFQNEDVTAGLIQWPTWPTPALAAFGSALITLRLLANALAHAITLMTGDDLVDLPPTLESSVKDGTLRTAE